MERQLYDEEWIVDNIYWDEGEKQYRVVLTNIRTHDIKWGYVI